jgi:phage nucleotide-binding protein
MGFADKIIAASEVADSGGLLIFLTGAPGTGKTTMIGTLDDIPEFAGRVLILAAGHGILALADRPNIAVYPVDKWSVLKEAHDYLSRKEHPYRVVAIDVATEAYHQVLLPEVIAEGLKTSHGQPTQEAYGVANSRFIQMVRDYRVLAERTGMYVIFTSHTSETKDEERGMILVRANLTPGTLSHVLGIVDVAGYLEVRPKKRLLYLVGTDRIWAKARKPVSYGPVPETIENPTFAKLFEALAPVEVKA